MHSSRARATARAHAPPRAGARRAPVHSARKFSAVRGTTSANSSNSMRPSGAPSAVTSKNTVGFGIFEDENESDLACQEKGESPDRKLQALLEGTAPSPSPRARAISWPLRAA